MKNLKLFIYTTILGGLTVILPTTLILIVLGWIFGKVTSLIHPVTEFVVVNSHAAEFVANVLVIVLMVMVCFLVGLFERTKLGKCLYVFLEKTLLKRLPGYLLVRETVVQFLGGKETPFSKVAIVRLYNSDTMATAFITDEHDDFYTVFVPTGPNPTSGQIFHLKKDDVYPLNTPIDLTMKSIISCGAGSRLLFSSAPHSFNSKSLKDFQKGSLSAER